jgi:CCR4-NOT complex subunit CAF16
VTAPAIEVRGLDFHYPNDDQPVLRDLHLEVPRGARCLLVGANGAGKSTLLFLLAGRYLIDGERVRVLGRPAFHDTTLTLTRTFLGGTFPMDVDIAVRELYNFAGARHDGLDPARRDRLLQILGVDPAWRMHRISDGQRRRVQILLGLLRPAEVLLLDEVTTDLDVIARADLLAFLREESETRGLTILYATHIFDGIERWATHIAHLAAGRMRRMSTLGEVPELAGSSLHRVVETWLRTHP